VAGLKIQRPAQAGEDLAADTLLERLDDGDALAVATKIECVKIVAVWVLGKLRDGAFSSFYRGLKTGRPPFVVAFEIAGIDPGCLVGHCVPGQAVIVGEFHRLLKFTGVVATPSLLQFLAGREWFLVTEM